MPVHLVVDGSNIATEGRTHPSIHQLREAVQALSAEHPAAKVIVVVDATFGHRIDPSEVPEFDAAVANNELVAPPAGAIGRGDAFVLGIADKVNGSILSNDSYQEFHGQYAWLFDEGRLIGGKPVPHVGWVFVNRLPVRGPLSRKSVSEAKRKGGRSKGPTAPIVGDGSVRVGSAEANKPMPVPKAPPPGAAVARAAKKVAAVPASASTTSAAESGGSRSRRGAGRDRAQAAPVVAAQPERVTGNGPLNDQLAFLSFVAEHPVGAPVEAVVDHYSSHGAYVRIGDVRGYVPLRLMGTPPPTSARSAMKIGETVHLVVHQYVAAKRSIDLAVASTAGSASATSTAGLRAAAATVGSVPPASARAAKAGSRRSTAAKAEPATTPSRSKASSAAAAAPASATRGTAKSATAKSTTAKKSAATTRSGSTAASATTAATKSASPKKGTSAKAAAPTSAASRPAAAAATTSASKKTAPTKAASTKAAPKAAASKSTASRTASSKSAAPKRAASKKAAPTSAAAKKSPPAAKKSSTPASRAASARRSAK